MSHSPTEAWAPTPTIELESDSFASGQVLSKMWMADQLENTLSQDHRLRIACYGSWYGWLSFFLFLRGKLPIEKVVCYDSDADAIAKARVIHEAFVMQGRFDSHALDVNDLALSTMNEHLGGSPDLIINTSTEHFTSDQWFENLPRGQWVALQACNMNIHDHVKKVNSEKEMVERFALREVAFIGTKSFRYPTWGFKRFMLIGRV